MVNIAGKAKKVNWKICCASKKNIFCNFLIWMGIACIPLVISVIISDIFDNMHNNNADSYNYLCAFLCILALLHSFLIIWGGKIDTLTKFTIRQKLRQNLILNSLNREKIKSGEMLELLSTDILSFEELVTVEIDLLCKLIFAAISFIILLNINVKITLFVLVPMVVVSNLIFHMGEKIKKSHNSARNSSIGYTSYINDVVRCWETIQLLGEKKDFLEKLKDMGNERKKLSIKQTVLNKWISELSDFSGILSIIIILLNAISELRSGELTLGKLTLLISLSGYISQYNGLFAEVFCAFKFTENTILRLHKLLENNDDIDQTVEEILNYNKEGISGSKSITVETIHLNFEGHEIRWNTNEGKFIAICGETGSGKSMLINAIVKEIKNRKMGDPSHAVGVAFQEPKFLDESIEENMLFLHAGNMEENLKKVNLIGELSEKIQGKKKIGVNGKALSEGQRQRLAIARAWCHSDKILVLDDSTSLIDYRNEIEILNLLKKSRETIIMASNRKNVLRTADEIIVMKSGGIDKIGTLRELKNQSDIFERIYNSNE